MADLPISNGGGGQTNTQSPQTATATDNGGTQSGKVQPGTDNTLLTSPGSVQLTPTALPTISLPNLNEARTTTGTPRENTTPAEDHGVNFALLGGSLLLLVVAVVVFMLLGRSEKNTTI